MATGRVYSSFSSFSSLEGACSFYHQAHFTLRETTGTEENQNNFCALCFLLASFESEVPQRVHAYKLLAENGNPECSPAFIAHLDTSFGLRPPHKGESLQHFRSTRERYSRPHPGMYPVTSALWEMMGYQPPLATPLLYKLMGLPEAQIARELDVSQYNVQLRLVKAVRLALRFVRHDRTIPERSLHSHTSRGDDRAYQKQAARRRGGFEDA